MTAPATGRPAPPLLEMWGGVECTVNRIGDRYNDQLTRLGHCARADDIDRFVALGIRALRLPILWERMQPERTTSPDWTWSDEALARLRTHEVRPMVGLLHHGYGPSWSGVLTPAFPTHFARYAQTVAERYPWVDAYTPINEPLTTARFSGLYGHWYPHACDPRVFARLVLAQCRATVRAMRAIRTVNPNAQLVQTEDFGKITGVPALAYQCDFENERRWLTWDLLTGSVDPSHPMWEYLRSLDVTEHELWEFVESPCAPDVIGVNHYVTSERYLDDRVEHYPSHQIGGNGYHQYADIATVHARDTKPAGIESLLSEVWERYRAPLAVTECHLGCTREEQLRWLHETWTAAGNLHGRGVDIRAVTSWALLGLYDWDSLVTRDDGHYEAGAFDLRAPKPRRTAIATMVRELATRGSYTHPVFQTHGWWQGQERQSGASPGVPTRREQLVLITGATGTLGQALARACQHRGIAYRLLTREMLDIANSASVADALRTYRPWAVINAAGYVRADAAEHDRTRCWRENTYGPAILAVECAARGIPLVTYSSDLVFDGQKESAYVESDTPSPLNYYGESKAAAESAVLSLAPASLTIRTSAFFSPWDEHNVVTQSLHALRAHGSVVVTGNEVMTPTYVPDLTQATLDLLIDGEQGIWHLSNGTPVTWCELVRRAAEALGIPSDGVTSRSTPDGDGVARRPPWSALASERGWIMPTLDNALERYTTLLREQWEASADSASRKSMPGDSLSKWDDTTSSVATF